MQSKGYSFVLSLATMLAILFSFSVQAQLTNTGPVTVITDKPDYAPRSNAVFTGSGFQPGETVALRVKNLFRACNTVTEDSSYLPWTVVADANGGFVTNWTVCDCPGDSLRLKAQGLSSNYVAYAYFTDGNFSFNTSGLPNGQAITVNYSWIQGSNTITGSKNFTTPNTSVTDGTNGNTVTFTYTPNPTLLIGGVKYQILNYTSTQNSVPTNSLSNQFLSGNGSAPARVITANYGALVVQPVSNATYGGTVDLSATFYSNYQTATKISGKSITFFINGISVGTASTNTSGVATIKDLDLTNLPTPLDKLNVGSYTIAASFDTDGNYLSVSNNNSTSAILTVNKRNATWNTNANSKFYGDIEPSPLTNGFGTNFLAVDGVSATYSRAGGEAVAGGPYKITATLSSTVVGALDNYTITNTGANFTIGKATVTVKANDASRKYGDANPAFSGSLSGIKNGDAITAVYSTAATSASGVGNYEITAGVNGDAATLANYEISKTHGTLTITPRPIQVTANAQTKYCGQDDPVFAYSITSGTLVGNDAFSGLISRKSGETINVSYEITQGTLTLGDNYTITFVPANFSILGIAIDASASGTPVAAGSTSVKLSASVTPKVAGIKIYFKFDNVEKGFVLTNNLGVATMDITTSKLETSVYSVVAYSAAGCTSPSLAYIPVYDPNNGFVTGGGWINSPAGAYVKEPTAVGKANFGFVAKYKKGSNAVEGETEFQFQAGSLNFKSTSYEQATLVISGAKASYRGVGTINGTGSYKFTLVAVDGDVNGGGGSDRVRMKITDLAGAIVYDNQINTDDNAGLDKSSTLLGGGSIVIHEVKAGKAAAFARSEEMDIISTEAFGLKAFPNPTTSQFTLKLESNNITDPITLRVTDLTGRMVRLIPSLMAGQTLQLGSEYKPGVYFVEMIQGGNRKQLKLIKQP